MVRYLKLIVIIFGSIGLVALGFFYYQNKIDISYAWEYKNKIDYEYLSKKCSDNYIYPCLEEVFEDYASKTSMTGISMGLKMVFNVMDQDKVSTDKFSSEKIRDLTYSLHYLKINNIALRNAYKRYHGMSNLYGGYIATLDRYYTKGYDFSDNIMIGLEGSEGIQTISDPLERKKLFADLKKISAEYFKIKKEVTLFLDQEQKRIGITE